MTNEHKYRSRQKRFTGCWTCRSRKVKCDEAVPTCQTCRKARLECSGYDSKFVWVKSENNSWTPRGRRFLRLELTWKGHSVLSSVEADKLIAECDQVGAANGDDVELLNLPFTVWRPNKGPTQDVLPLVPLQLFRAPSTSPLTNDMDSRLFNHYVGHIAVLMMPFEDTRNPWKTLYPALAIQQQSREQKAMIKAMMSQAAFNLAHLGYDTNRMLRLGNTYYQASIQELRSCAGKPADCGEFIATVLTMMMAEVYSGRNKNWRVHFRGGWNYLLEYYGNGSLADSKVAFEFLQSLVVIKLVQETSQLEQLAMVHASDADRTNGRSIVTWLSSLSAFGFSIGASNLLLSCIWKIESIKALLPDHSTDLDREANDVLARLHNSEALGIVEDWRMLAKYDQIVQCHFRAFRSATFIYLYRVLFDLSPRVVEPHVSEVFQSVDNFYRLGGGNLSLWPAFIAAVEAYTDTDMEMAKNWLAMSIDVGMGNRYKIKSVVEQVWQIRGDMSRQTSHDKGNIAVDWRDVMQNLDLDVLLV